MNYAKFWSSSSNHKHASNKPAKKFRIHIFHQMQHLLSQEHKKPKQKIS